MRTIIPQGSYTYFGNFLANQESAEYYHSFLEGINWRQEHLKMYGKSIPFPRLTAYYGDEGKEYTYSKQTRQPESWTPTLISLKEKIEKLIPTTFNAVLLNLYRDGNDSMSWHSDNEPELGLNPVIASVNIGAERVFQLKHKTTKERIDILLENGSLLIMEGEMQTHWVHQIPKTKKLIGPRINLTFRRII